MRVLRSLADAARRAPRLLGPFGLIGIVVISASSTYASPPKPVNASLVVESDELDCNTIRLSIKSLVDETRFQYQTRSGFCRSDVVRLWAGNYAFTLSGKCNGDLRGMSERGQIAVKPGVKSVGIPVKPEPACT